MSEQELREVLREQNNPTPLRGQRGPHKRLCQDFNDDVWRTRERRAILVTDMSDGHIINARAMLQSGLNQGMYTNRAAVRVRQKYIKRFTNELAKRKRRKEIDEFAKTREAVMADHTKRMAKRTHEYGELLKEMEK